MFECPPITIVARESLLHKRERGEHFIIIGLGNNSKLGDYFFDGDFV